MKKSTIFFIVIALLITVQLWAWSSKHSRNAAITTAAGFKDYHLGTHPVTVKLPQTTRVVAETPGNNEMIFSAFLRDETLDFQGYVQLWNITDLEKFLASSREHSRFDFKEFKQRKIKLKTCQGFQIDWRAVMQDKKPATGREYFVKKDDSYEVLRISIFTGTASLPKELAEVADSIISSIEWK